MVIVKLQPTARSGAGPALAVEAWRSVQAESQLVRALVALSRQQWLTEQTSAARESAEEALVLSQRACGTP